jgi:hypothetical protein
MLNLRIRIIIIFGKAGSDDAGKKKKPVAPAHFVRKLEQSLQVNLVADQTTEQWKAWSRGSALRPGSVAGVINRLEKALCHEREMLECRHERLQQAVDAFSSHGKHIHELRLIKAGLVGIADEDSCSLESLMEALVRVWDSIGGVAPADTVTVAIERGVKETFPLPIGEVSGRLFKLFDRASGGLACRYYKDRADDASAAGHHIAVAMASVALALGYFAEGRTEADGMRCFYHWFAKLVDSIKCLKVGIKEPFFVSS